MLNLGLMYEEGTGVAQSGKDATSWFTKAANAGNPAGWFDLGQMYEDGLAGVPRDLGRARDLYTRAAKLGNAEAKKRLDSMPAN
jgi:TPR repeat protein